MQLTLPTISQEDVIFWCTLLGAVGGFLAWMRKRTKPTWERIKYMALDWTGVPDRPGVKGRPGVMEHMANIEKIALEARYHSMPNGGNSAYDKLSAKLDRNRDETRDDVAQVQSDVSALITTLAEHSDQLRAFEGRMDASEKDRQEIHRDISLFRFGKTENHTGETP